MLKDTSSFVYMHRKSTILAVFSLETLIHHSKNIKNNSNGIYKTENSYARQKMIVEAHTGHKILLLVLILYLMSKLHLWIYLINLFEVQSRKLIKLIPSSFPKSENKKA